MNNPPDISQDPAEHEEYAHNVQKHVRGYLVVGALLLTFTGITVALSYVDFGTRKANISVAMLVATQALGTGINKGIQEGVNPLGGLADLTVVNGEARLILHRGSHHR